MKDFQKAFVQAITSGDVSPLEKYGIQPSQNLSVTEALQTYRNDYTARLSDALASHFKSVHYILGDQTFFTLTKQYLSEHPSQYSDLGQYGQDFPAFLGKSSERDTFPFLRALAEIEWLCLSYFDTPPNVLADLHPLEDPTHLGEARIKWVPHTLISHPYPLAEFWRWRHQPSLEIEVTQEAYHCLVYKKGLFAEVHTLSENQKRMFLALSKGMTVSDSLDELDPKCADLASDIAGFFAFVKQGQVVQQLAF